MVKRLIIRFIDVKELEALGDEWDMETPSYLDVDVPTTDPLADGGQEPVVSQPLSN